MKKIRIGVFGARRGMDIARNFMLLNCEISAICDSDKNQLKKSAENFGGTVAAYADFDAFIEHDMEAVILANSFHEHAPYAIRCLQKGLHVFSECLSNGTMAEGVELVEAVEKSNSIYMLAENYPHMIFNREMKRIADGGSLGRIMYAEGEYNHPVASDDIGFLECCNYYEKHWRNFLPSTYYITHSLGPVMHISGAMPKKVCAFTTFDPPAAGESVASHNGDGTAIIITQNDDESIFRVTGWAKFGAHHISYRICGTDGQIENLRGTDEMMLRYNNWTIPENMKEINRYKPEWNDKDEKLLEECGHGGADFFTARMFVECIKANRQPEHPFDVYGATNMSSVAFLAHRSILDGGKVYEIPDFKREEDRNAYRDDRLSPFYGFDGTEPSTPCCSHPDYKPPEENVRAYKKLLNLE